MKVWLVNSGMAKEELYRWLRLERPTDEDLEKGVPHPPGYCHFPRYSEEYFHQITAKQLVARLVKGYRKLDWEKMRDRNEALDCRVYARASAARVGLDRFQEKHWRVVADRMGVPLAPAPQQQPPPPVAPQGRPQPPRRGRRVTGRFGR